MKKILVTTLALGLLGGFLLWQGNFGKVSAPIAQVQTADTTYDVTQTATVVDSESTAVTSQATSTTADVIPVVRVIDGDTIVVTLAGKDDTVRLLGMDTPETVDPRKPVQCFGPQASAETKSLLDGQSVHLTADPTQSDRDKYGRLLRYVFRDDGLFVDEFLVQQGFAREYTYFSVPYKYQTAFRADQSAAKSAGLGLWSIATCNGKR
jgi:micrococcal nuclease